MFAMLETSVVTAVDQTITASDETGSSQETLNGLIEISAAVQPGDSGGATVNTYGQVIGMTTAEAASVGQDPSALIERLGIESGNAQCLELACIALLDAIRDYSNATRDDWAGDEALICTCFFVSERTIEHEIQSRGLKTVAEVTDVCNAGGGCGSCHQLIEEILATNDLPG